VTEGGNPYVGLRPFSPEDSLYFFGRHEQTGELLRQLSGNRFLAVVGSSGCGKSSLLRAGLIPALEAGFLVEERDRWQMTQMRPGDGPFRALAEGLLDIENHIAIEARVPPSLPSNRDTLNCLIEELRESSAERVIAVLRARLDARSSYLLIVDQFEEIFRFRGRDSDENPLNLSRDALLEQARRREEAEDFVELLLSLSAQEDLPVYVVLSMRSDFLGDCDVFFGLPEAMNRSRFLVPRLTRQQMRQAIEGPARLVGATLAPKLVDRVLNELGDRTDHLPVLQHALMRTFEKWLGTGAIGEISSQAYEQAGGLENALSLHAEEAVVEEDVAITKRLFQCLTDTDSQGRRIRRPCRLDELVAICEVDHGILLNIINRFNADKRNFLVVTDQSEGNPRVDISHESLIRVWTRLRDWAQEEADSAVIYRRLADIARRYTPIHAVLQDPELQTTLDWYDRHQPIMAWAQRYDADFELAKEFLLRSQAQRDSEVAAVAARKRQKRLALAGVLAFIVFIGMAVGYQRLENLRNQEALIKAEEGIQEASMLARGGDHQSAATRLEQSRQIFAALEQIPQEIRAMRLQAFYLSRSGAVTKARDLLREALVFSKKEGNPQLMGEVLAATAMLEDDAGNNGLALQDYQEALDLFVRSADAQEQGRMLERLALSQQNVKNYDQAVERYQEALTAFQTAGDTLGERRIERQLSEVTPWGFLTNLRTGTLTPMRGYEAVFRVGRGPSNNLSLETNNLLSRWHVELQWFKKDSQVHISDLRTTNGSSLNGHPLAYANPQELRDGDIFSLAWQDAFLFTKKRRNTSPPAGSWGILVSNKGFTYLVDPQYSIIESGDGVVTETDHFNGMTVSWDGQCATVHVPEKGYSLVHWVMEIELQRQYKAFVTKSGLVPLARIPFPLSLHKKQGDEISQKGTYFQIIHMRSVASGCMK